MKLRLSLTVLVLIALLVTGCGRNEIKDAENWPVKDFKATNQDNKPVELKDLKGKIWVADFIFTNCIDVCPPMTANMAKLQKKVKDEGLENVQFVSFSVDPTVDTPEKMAKYAGQFQTDLKNWTFLTGYSQEFIEDYAKKSFKALVKKPEEGNQVIHQMYFYLVDKDGTIKKYYSGLNDVPYDEIMNDIKALQ